MTARLDCDLTAPLAVPAATLATGEILTADVDIVQCDRCYRQPTIEEWDCGTWTCYCLVCSQSLGYRSRDVIGGPTRQAAIDEWNSARSTEHPSTPLVRALALPADADERVTSSRTALVSYLQATFAAPIAWEWAGLGDCAAAGIAYLAEERARNIAGVLLIELAEKDALIRALQARLAAVTT